MRPLRMIFRRTLGGLWPSFTSVFAVTAFLLLSGGAFIRVLLTGEGGSTPVAALWAVSAAPFLPLLATLLTMRLFADERRDGRLALLLTAPIRERTVVVGKFMGAYCLVAGALIVYLAMPLVSLPACAPVLAERLTFSSFLLALTALLLQGAAWCAFGLCASACCRQASVAAVLNLLCVVAMPYAVFWAGAAWSPALRIRFSEMPYSAHVTDMATGLISPAMILFYLLLTAFGLFAAAKVVAALRFRGRTARGVRFSGGLVVLLAIVCVGFMTAVAVRLDTPFEWPFSTVQTALSKQTEQALSELYGEVTVTCFLSRKDSSHRVVSRLMRGLSAAARKTAGARLNVEWVDPRWERGRAARLVRQGVKEGSLVFRAGRRRLDVPVETLFAATNGLLQVSPQSIFQGEKVCAAALRRLARPLHREKIYWTTGHGEASFSSYDPLIGMSDSARALRRNGYRLETLDLSQALSVPDDCAVLLVAGARESFSRTESARLRTYLQRGGRLLVLATDRPNAGAGTLLAEWGVKSLPFTVVSSRTQTGTDVVADAFADHRVTAPLKKSRVVFENAVPIQAVPATAETDFTALVRTDEAAWGESDRTVRPWIFDGATEPRGPLTLAAAVEHGEAAAKDLALRPTRIVVIGDAAFVSNGARAARANANEDLFLNAVAWLAGLDVSAAAHEPGDGVAMGLDRAGWRRFGLRSLGWVVLVWVAAGLTLLWRKRRVSA